MSILTQVPYANLPNSHNPSIFGSNVGQVTGLGGPNNSVQALQGTGVYQVCGGKRRTKRNRKRTHRKKSIHKKSMKKHKFMKRKYSNKCKKCRKTKYSKHHYKK